MSGTPNTLTRGSLFRLHARQPHELRVAVEVPAKESREFLGARAAAWLQSLRCVEPDRVRVRQRILNRSMQRIHRRTRRALRNEDAVPADVFVTGHTGLVHGWKLRHQCGTLARGDRNAAQTPCFDMAYDCGCWRDAERRLS